MKKSSPTDESIISTSSDPYAHPRALYQCVFNKPGDVPRMPETHAFLFSELAPEVISAIKGAVPDELPAEEKFRIAAQVKRGVRQALHAARTDNMELTYSALMAIPHDWEPPLAVREAEPLPRPLRQVYRLTAAFFAACMRSALDELRGNYTFKQHTQRIDEALLNTTYRMLLTHPEHIWNVSEPARLNVWLAPGHPNQLPLPPVVGN